MIFTWYAPQAIHWPISNVNWRMVCGQFRSEIYKEIFGDTVARIFNPNCTNWTEIIASHWRNGYSLTCIDMIHYGDTATCFGVSTVICSYFRHRKNLFRNFSKNKVKLKIQLQHNVATKLSKCTQSLFIVLESNMIVAQFLSYHTRLIKLIEF